MDLVYFLQDIHKKLDCSTSQQEANFTYLYNLLPETIKNKKITSTTRRCKEIIKSGVRRFQECGHPCVDDSQLCEHHTEKKGGETECKPPVVAKVTGQVRIKKNKYGHFLYPNTKLIIASGSDKTIIGKENEIGQQVPLDDESIGLCDVLSLKYRLQN